MFNMGLASFSNLIQGFVKFEEESTCEFQFFPLLSKEKLIELSREVKLRQERENRDE